MHEWATMGTRDRWEVDLMAESWEPGPPSVRAMAPGVIGGAIIPLAVYYTVRPHLGGDAPALMIAGVPAAAWVAIQWARQRRIDPIGAIVLFGFVAGVIVSVALGGSAFVLKVRDSGFTCVFGLACLASLTRRKPVMFYIGRAMSAGSDPAKLAVYDQLWDVPTAPRTFRIITVAWGAGLIVEGTARVILAMTLPTETFLAVSPVLAAVVIGGLFTFSVRWSKRARRIGEELFATTGMVYPSLELPTA